MARIPRISTIVGLALAFVILPTPAPAHDGDNPHVPDAWYAGYDWLTFDKNDGQYEPGLGWHFAAMVDTIDARTAGANMPVIRMAECENTVGPCVDVFEVCRPGEPWMIHYDWNNFGPVHGQVLLNHCGDVDTRDRSASCRVVMRLLGVHNHTGAGCTSSPWSLSADYPTDTAYDVVNSAYQAKAGRQLP